MGRDTTARKRMADKRSREKASGLRRLNVAVTPEVYDKLAELMQQRNCASQARLIELLVMDNSFVSSPRQTKDSRNDVTKKESRTEATQKVLPTAQMNLFLL